MENVNEGLQRGNGSSGRNELTMPLLKVPMHHQQILLLLQNQTLKTIHTFIRKPETNQ